MDSRAALPIETEVATKRIRLARPFIDAWRAIAAIKIGAVDLRCKVIMRNSITLLTKIDVP